MEFGRFPPFLGNKRTSGIQIGSFGVLPKTFVMKLFSQNVAFLRNVGEWAEWNRMGKIFISKRKKRLRIFKLVIY